MCFLVVIFLFMVDVYIIDIFSLFIFIPYFGGSLFALFPTSWVEYLAYFFF